MARSRHASCPPRPTCANRCGAPSGDSHHPIQEDPKMNMMRIARTGLCAAAVALLVAGCSSVSLDDKKGGVPVETGKPNVVQPGGGASTGSSQSQVASIDLTKKDQASQA